jgi:hypothetical protein
VFSRYLTLHVVQKPRGEPTSPSPGLSLTVPSLTPSADCRALPAVAHPCPRPTDVRFGVLPKLGDLFITHQLNHLSWSDPTPLPRAGIHLDTTHLIPINAFQAPVMGPYEMTFFGV